MPAPDTRPHHEDSRYRYCTNFIVTGTGLESRSFVPMLEELGDSVLVVGDEATLKVHVHTDEPDVGGGAVRRRRRGDAQLDVADMREQVAERSAHGCRRAAAPPWRSSPAEGMRELYEGLGAYVVDGGETFNPSIYDLLAAIHEVPAEEVLVFPNNPNVVMAAERAAELSDKEARVVRLHLAAGRPRRPGRARSGGLHRRERGAAQLVARRDPGRARWRRRHATTPRAAL